MKKRITTQKLELKSVFAERTSDNQIIQMQDAEINNLNMLLKFAELQKNLRKVNILEALTQVKRDEIEVILSRHDLSTEKALNNFTYKTLTHLQEDTPDVSNKSPIKPDDFDLRTLGYMALCRLTDSQRIQTRIRMYPIDKTCETQQRGEQLTVREI